MPVLSEFTVTNRESVARFFGTSASTVARWHQAGMPGQKGSWDLSAIAQWREQVLKAAVDDAISDPDMVGGEGSPALERYRSARAAIAELELQRKQESLVDRNLIENELLRCADVIRGRLEIINTEPNMTGREALDLFLDCLDELDAHLTGNEGDQP